MSIKKLINRAAMQLEAMADRHMVKIPRRDEMLLVLSHELADQMHESTADDIEEARHDTRNDIRQLYMNCFFGIPLKVQADKDAPYLMAGKDLRVMISPKTFSMECMAST